LASQLTPATVSKPTSKIEASKKLLKKNYYYFKKILLQIPCFGGENAKFSTEKQTGEKFHYILPQFLILGQFIHQFFYARCFKPLQTLQVSMLRPMWCSEAFIISFDQCECKV
jgi:hypothetical protein